MEQYDVKRSRVIKAHTHPLAAIALSLDGKLLATASEQGTLVRIHATSDGSKLQARAGCPPAATEAGTVQLSTACCRS